MEIVKQIEILKETTNSTMFGRQVEAKVEPPFPDNQLKHCGRCPKYKHGCSGPYGEFNNILKLNFSKYFDSALVAFDQAICGLGFHWNEVVKKAGTQKNKHGTQPI